MIRKLKCKNHLDRNIQENEHLIKQNSAKLHLMAVQLKLSNDEERKARLSDTMSKIEREIEEVELHNDVLRQYSSIALPELVK